MDWIKLLLARVATALFWFNPLVWVLAREAHQLREETADDAVLAADISDTDYAAAPGRRRPPRMPGPAARRAWCRAVEELARSPRRPSARRQVGARPGRAVVRARRVRRRGAGCSAPRGSDGRAGGHQGKSRRRRLRAPRRNPLIIRPRPKPRSRPTLEASSRMASRRRSRPPLPPPFRAREQAVRDVRSAAIEQAIANAGNRATWRWRKPAWRWPMRAAR